MRAAQYVRMSTEHQQYSIENQQSAILKYAVEHGYEVVKTYADPARSGLDIRRRPGLRSLIDDVIAGHVDFQIVLVMDVTRWGRFQDTDEAACYEFLCKRAGIQVHYCAEPFPNDGSMSSTFLKMIKRSMAAEYLRELSAKVHAGQVRLASYGFKQGGSPGYGLRRLLLDVRGQPKAILQSDERKSLLTERVTYTLGPEEELCVVREIYSLFLQGYALQRIKRLLNQRDIKGPGLHGKWSFDSVYRILTHPKYTGCIVYNRRSARLRSKTTLNPREQWVLTPGCFPAIISQEVFDKTQERFANLTNRRSNERLLAELRTFIKAHGHPVWESVNASAGIASYSTYRNRFGSMMAVYEMIDHRAARYTMKNLDSRQEVAALKISVLTQLEQEISSRKLRFHESGPVLHVWGHGSFLLRTGRCHKTRGGDLRWKIWMRARCRRQPVIVIRLQPGNSSIKDFVVMLDAPRRHSDFTLSEDTVSKVGRICSSASEVVNLILGSRNFTPDKETTR